MRQIRKTGILGLVLGAVLLAGPVQAEQYNDGLLAAEAGDYTAAAKSWVPLADRGDANAQFNLALMYHSGLGVKADEGLAVSWYHRAAENGNHRAQEFLEVAYREGWFGLQQSTKLADYWAQRQMQSAP